VAGCASSNRSAGHASAQANLKLTFHLDYSVGADQSDPRLTWRLDLHLGKFLLWGEVLPSWVVFKHTIVAFL
jgi:hypothetical protein